MGMSEDMEIVKRQERELILPRLDAKVAWELGTKLKAIAEERSLAVVIDIRRFGQPLFYAALDGTSPNNVEWVRRKSNVVQRFHRSSYGVRLGLLLNEQTLESADAAPYADYAEHGGSFPLTVATAGVIGSVTISGLEGREDHGLAVEGLCALLGKDYKALKLAPAPH
jgi:uncharacterized protein (UPF0303 family)